MVGMDLETAVREHIPILILLVNNSAMGGYEQYIPKAAIEGRVKFLSGNYSQVARGLGAYAERIDRPEAVQAALQRGIAATREGQPALLEFITCEETDIAKR
jgi:thiamine pyrophosphate-dependent acetolactate synthase large subunit-like protein